MDPIRGEAVLLNFWNGSEYVPFACTRSITINLQSEFIGISTVGSGDWKEKQIVALDWNFSFEGIFYLATSGYYDTTNIIDLWINKTSVQIQFYISDGTTSLLMTGTAIITSVSMTGSVNNVASVNVSGEGTGALTSSTNFEIIEVEEDTPGVNQTTLTFSYDSVPGATGYTIKIIDHTLGTETNDTQGEPPVEIVVDSNHNYSFTLRVEPDGEIFFGNVHWPVPYTANDSYLVDTDGYALMDTDNEYILTE
jgi:predicted secreted protein